MRNRFSAYYIYPDNCQNEKETWSLVKHRRQGRCSDDRNGVGRGDGGDDGDDSVIDGVVGDFDVGDGGGEALGCKQLSPGQEPSLHRNSHRPPPTRQQALWYTMPMVVLRPSCIHTSEPGAAFLAVWGEGLARAVDHHHHDGCRADGGDDYHLKSNHYEAGSLLKAYLAHTSIAARR